MTMVVVVMMMMIMTYSWRNCSTVHCRETSSS